MDESSQAAFIFFLFLDLLLNWSKAAICAAVALFIRNRSVSAVLALITGAFEGLFGPRLELFDLYLTRSGWEAIDALTWTTIALSALASLMWWIAARGLYALARRVVRGSAAAS
jgi:hypothetical protein